MLAYAWHLWSDQLRAALAPMSSRIPLFALALVLASPVFVFPLEDPSNFIPIIGFLMLSIASGIVLIVCYANDILSGKFWAFLKFVGFYSYGIYLWHVKCRDLAVFLIDKLHFAPNITWMLGMVLYIGLAIGAGVITTRLIELPILRLREKIAA
ncbi:MAG: hypothetical protein QM758_06855 [Armatimonas sp.]